MIYVILLRMEMNEDRGIIFGESWVLFRLLVTAL